MGGRFFVGMGLGWFCWGSHGNSALRGSVIDADIDDRTMLRMRN